MKIIKSIIAAALSLAITALVLDSCASTDKAENSGQREMEEINAAGDWVLNSFIADDKIQAITISTVSIDKSDNNLYTFSGYSGVNTFRGKLFADGASIDVDKDIATTRMAGSAEAMEFEKSFLKMLSESDSWIVKEDEGKKVLEITSRKQKAKAKFMYFSLPDTRWNLESINTGSAVISVNSKLALLLMLDRKASAFTGINTLNVDFTLDENTRQLSFDTNGVMTLASGSDEDMETERLFIQNLMNTASYSLCGRELSLYGKDGQILLIFTKQDFV